MGHADKHIDKIALLNELISEWEHETVEFKGSGGIPFDKIGKYFSALSNEANLKDQKSAWLIFGVNDKSREIEGTDYSPNKGTSEVQSLKHSITQKTNSNISFKEIWELEVDDKRVIMFQIPAAHPGIPTTWDSIPYGREDESLVHLSDEKKYRITSQPQSFDWSAQVIPDASIDDLDPDAIEKVREIYSSRHSEIPKVEIKSWDTLELLRKSKLVSARGHITNTTLLLLGREELANLLTPSVAQVTWRNGEVDREYRHFTIPYLISLPKVYRQIRNSKVRLLPPGEIEQIEVDKYEQGSILEALYNAVAHSDYIQNPGRIAVTEFNSELEIQSNGGFFEGKPEDYLSDTLLTPQRYRNKFLADALYELNLVDTAGYGVKKIHKSQFDRYLPLPDYKIKGGRDSSVSVRIYGGEIDKNYTQQLMKLGDELAIVDALALDRVQKKQKISLDSYKKLKNAGLIMGQRSNPIVSSAVAMATNTEIQQHKESGIDDRYYQDYIVGYLKKYHSASRTEIEELITDKLGTSLSEEQKYSKITAILVKAKRENVLKNIGSRKKSRWVLVDGEP